MAPRHDQLLRNHIALKKEKGLESEDVFAYTDSAEMTELFLEMDDVYDAVENSMAVLVNAMNTSEGIDVEKYAEEFDAVLSSIQDMKVVIDKMQKLENITPKEKKGFQEMFAQYMYVIDSFERNANIALDAEKDDGAHIYTKVSTDAIDFLRIGYNSQSQMFDDAVTTPEMARVNVESGERAKEWVMRYCYKLSGQFSADSMTPEKAAMCADEVYLDTVHEKDFTHTAWALGIAIDFKMARLAELMEDGASEEDIAAEKQRIQNGLEALQEWWAARLPEVAVKYEALAAELPAIIGLLRAHAREQDSFVAPQAWGSFGGMRGGGQNDAELLN